MSPPGRPKGEFRSAQHEGTPVSDGGGALESRCPRCGGAFRCGMHSDAGPCACTSLRLDVALLAQLRERYDGCLCMTCLAQLQAAAPAPE